MLYSGDDLLDGLGFSGSTIYVIKNGRVELRRGRLVKNLKHPYTDSSRSLTLKDSSYDVNRSSELR